MRKGRTVLLAMACCFVATSLHAAEEEVSFHYTLEELANSESAEELFERVRQTARANCPRSATVPRRLVRECRQNIEEQLMVKIEAGDLADTLALDDDRAEENVSPRL
ncbi:UrcA family protein [Aurantiacibacter hainanensis]|uniref:UrcA family protein n=1 Tax=Aurantiacibacter hainanensis TaxID=3076114 RepID=UPI0030C6689E